MCDRYGRISVVRWLAIGIPLSVVLVLLIFSVRPPTVLVTMPLPQEVQTLNPKVGVHTRLTDEVEAWKIQKSLAMIREMGAPWIVEYVPWAYIETARGEYHWDHTDLIVDHAVNQGLRVIARLGMVPQWARPEPGEKDDGVQVATDTYLDAEHYDDFASFVGAFSSRYRGRVEHVIIWNEPNLSFEWGYRAVDPEGYVDLLSLAYVAAHEANPDIVVLAGALAPTLEPVGSVAGLNDLVYLRAMYEAGASDYLDALAAHAYGMAFAPNVEPNEDLITFRRVELLREIMIEYGDREKLVYITEAGWNDHPRWIWAVRPGQRVQYTLDAYRWAVEEWPWCPVVAIWMFRTPQPLYNYQDYYAFVTPEFVARPIYSAVSEYTRGVLIGETIEAE